MATRPLPERPSLDRLRRQARDLQRRVRSGELAAPEGVADPAAFPLQRAQLALAREFGFASWTRLVRAVEQIDRLRFDAPAADPADPVGAFSAQAVLTWADTDGPDRWAAARRRLAASPDLVERDLAAAAVATDPSALAVHLRRDRAAARKRTGPLDWEPLLYLAYSRLRDDVTAPEVDACLTLLLDAGADPNAGRFFAGLATPFTALTGVFGSADRARPAHPQQSLFARRLLVAGADPNDGQALYNRMFQPTDDHLRLLFAHGLGTGDGGIWHSRLPEQTESPEVMLVAQLAWAVMHGLGERIVLLAGHGVDVRAPITVRRLIGAHPLTPWQLAVRSGQPAATAALRDLGAAENTVVGDTLEALMAGREPVDAATVAQLRRTDPALILRAAVADRPEGMRALVRHGFDVNAYGRQDSVIAQEWETALHHAAGEGKTEMVRLLLDLGADPTVKDKRFDSTPREWAEHLGHAEAADLL